MWKRRGGFSVRVKTKASQKEEKPLTGSRGFQRAYRAWGAEIADWQGDGFVVKRSRVRVPAGASGQFSFLGSLSVQTLISVSVPPLCYRSSTL